jgi:hypothetical protein
VPGPGSFPSTKKQQKLKIPLLLFYILTNAYIKTEKCLEYRKCESLGEGREYFPDFNQFSYICIRLDIKDEQICDKTKYTMVIFLFVST